MFWLRSILFSLPLVLVLAASWLFGKIGGLQLSGEAGAFVYAIQEPVGYLNPLVPSSGITGEITDLIFEPLLVRDEELHLRPHLLERWNSRTVVTIRCSSEEAAGASEAKLRSGEYLEEAMKLLAIERSESVLTVALEGVERDLESRLLKAFSKEDLGDYLRVRITLRHSIRDSFEAFLQGSVEKSQIRMVEFAGDREANLFVRGDTELFLRELRLYYESNPGLEPVVEELGEQCHTTSREMLLDLRNDVKWHDGRSLTAEDVVFSFRELTRPDSPLPLAASFWFVDNLEAVAPHRIRVGLKEAPATMLESWEKLPVLPSHLLRSISDVNALEAFFLSPVGTGPYRFERRRDDGGVVLTANEGYFRTSPLEKQIRYQMFGSLEATLLALRSGSLHAIVPDERFSDWSERNPGSVAPLRGLPRFQHFVAWNLERPPFDSHAVRSALAKSIDLKQVLRDTATEFQLPVTSLFFPGIPYCKEPMLLPLYDPRGAERLLEEAGYPRDDSGGVRVNPDGKELSFRLSVNEANGEHRRLAGHLAEQWEALGLKVEVEFLSWADLLATRLGKREFDAVLLSWEVPFERDRSTTWHSSETAPGGGNFCGLRNEDVDEILEKLRQESDEKEVAILTSRLQKAIADLQPCYFLCDTGRILTVRSDAIMVVPPTESGGLSAARTLEIGGAGLERSRPWWIRKETLHPPVGGGGSSSD